MGGISQHMFFLHLRYKLPEKYIVITKYKNMILKGENMNNLFTIIAIVIIAYMLYPKIMIKFNKNVKNVSGEEAVKLIREKKDLVVLDVRSKGEYQTGHINGSKLMPASEIALKITELEKFRDKPILVHCAAGGRSPRAVNILLKNKFGPIYHMNHGLSDFNGALKK